MPYTTAPSAKTLRNRPRARGLQVHYNKHLLHSCNALRNVDLDRLKEALVQDSSNLFSKKGMDTSIYEKNVQFRDPITKYDDIQVRYNHCL
jgi:hypothetical protein